MPEFADLYPTIADATGHGTEIVRYIPQKERDSYDEADFAGPDRSFPITSQAQLDAAAHLIGHAADPAAVKSKAIAIAKRKGFALPDAWKEKEDRAMTTDTDLQMYLPITRIDKEKWMIEGQATSDAIDHYETIFDYDSSKRAFATWRGNIREMHQNKAVGRAVEVIPNDEERTITVRAFVSKGARDTWEKVNDGTLSGFSIGVPKNGYKLRMVERNGKSVPMYYDHKLAEVSLVDNPGSPGCDIAIVRADGMLTDVIDTTEEETPEDITRKGAPISKMNRDKLHGIRNDAMQMCSDNGCDECKGMMASQDGDGDSDRSIEAAIQRHMQPLVHRVHTILSEHISRSVPVTTTLQSIPSNDEAITRLIEAMETRYNTELSKVLAVLTGVEDTVKRIAATPLPGGPVATPVPMDKRLATSPHASYSPDNDIAAIQRAQSLGLFKDQESQVAAAARLISLQNAGRG